jgi:hypothetical protein
LIVGLLLTAFLLGVLHGVTPDEHTWPITMSYAIGAASGRRGMQAGLLFSAAFTLQRALASELAFLALAPILASGSLNAAIDLGVGLVMAVSVPTSCVEGGSCTSRSASSAGCTACWGLPRTMRRTGR